MNHALEVPASCRLKSLDGGFPFAGTENKMSAKWGGCRQLSGRLAQTQRPQTMALQIQAGDDKMIFLQEGGGDPECGQQIFKRRPENAPQPRLRQGIA